MSLNFVAAEDGLEDGPKFLKLARLLKVPRGMAFWCLLRLRRLLVNEGNLFSGALPQNYDSMDLAAFLEWRGKPGTLIAALKETGFLGFRRGVGFFLPGWALTVTGSYAIDRENRRTADRDRKREARGGGLGEQIGNVSSGRPADTRGRPAESVENLEIKEGRTSDGTPPTPPPAGGDSLADARWQWVLDHAENPQNPDYCRQILGKMSDENWELVQRAWGPRQAEWGPLYRRNARVLAWPSDAFLRKQAFLRWRPKPPPRPIVRAPASAVRVISPAAELEKRLLETDSYVMQALDDPDLADEKKKEIREKWLERPENRDRVPPWKKAAQPTNGHRAKVGDA